MPQDTAARNELYSWAMRHGLFEPYDFAICHEEHHGDRDALARYARSWQDRHLRSRLRDLEAKREELQRNISNLHDTLRHNEERKFA